MPCVFPLCDRTRPARVLFYACVSLVTADYTVSVRSNTTVRLRGNMKSPIQTFYSYLREAMFANKITASDISAHKGVHYTYIYNTIRKNANITLRTATQLAEAAGYHLEISFKPLDASKAVELEGTFDPDGPIYTARRVKSKAEASDAAAPADADKVATDAALDAEIEALLNG